MSDLQSLADWAFRMGNLNPTDTAHQDALSTLSSRSIPATEGAIRAIETAYRFGTNARRYHDSLLEDLYQLVHDYTAAHAEEGTL